MLGTAGQKIISLQEPGKHIGDCGEATVGQREAVTEGLDSEIWNQIHKQIIHVYLYESLISSLVKNARETAC